MVRHLGRIPVIIHTDHANTSRLEALPLARVDAKHVRWCSELLQGGSRLHRPPGLSSSNRSPHAISRHPEGRGQLVLARASEWNKHHVAIRGVQQSIMDGEFEDDEPAVVNTADLPPEALEPVAFEDLEAGGALPEGGKEEHFKQLQNLRKEALAVKGAEDDSKVVPNGPGGRATLPRADMEEEMGVPETVAASTPSAPGVMPTRLKVLFLGPWAMTTIVHSVGQARAKRLAKAFEVGAACVVLDPPFSQKKRWIRRAIGFVRLLESRRKESVRWESTSSLASLLSSMEFFAGGRSWSWLTNKAGSSLR